MTNPDIQGEIELVRKVLSPSEQSVVSDGSRSQSDEQCAPRYQRDRVKWLAPDARSNLQAVLTADILRDWLYIDELWGSPGFRGNDLGRRLMRLAEESAISPGMQGAWLKRQERVSQHAGARPRCFRY